MARTSPKRIVTGKRVIGPKARFAPDLLALEDRSVPAFIYVDPTFTAGQNGNPAQDFNAGGVGQATVSKSLLTFVATGDSAGVTGTGKFATSDLTTAFNAARDNPGADTIVLAASDAPFSLDNSQGKSATLSGGFNDNTYFFNSDPLSILGSGATKSVIKPTVSTFDSNNIDTESDPVFAVRNGATFVGSDFGLDGSAGKFGVGVGVSGGTLATFTNVAVKNFVALDGSTTNGSTFGYGIAVNPNAGGAVVVTGGTFSGNARAGVSFTNADGQVLGSSFTGRGQGNLVDYGIQVAGTSRVYASGNTITGYLGTAAADGSQSAGIFASQDVDPSTGQPVAGGAQLLAVGNTITGNLLGVSLGSIAGTGDTSVAVVNYNDLSGDTTALDATRSAFGPTVTTGVTAGIDGRFNFFGTGGPNRQASTGSNGDQLTNPSGTGSKADGNVRIDGFKVTAISPAVPLTVTAGVTFGTTATPAQSLAAAAGAARVPFTAGTTLTIYVNGSENAFTDSNGDGFADQVFNSTNVGPLGTQPGNSITFVPSGTRYGSFTVPANGKIAVPDLTTAFNIARDNGGADTILLASSTNPFLLDNSQGMSATLSGGFNDNTYFFTGAGNTLTIKGSGVGNTVIEPTTSTYDPATPDTASDPVFAIRGGDTFAGSDFSFDGTLGKFGGGIGASGGSTLSLARVALRDFVAQDGSTSNGFTSGYGLFVNNAAGAGGAVTVTDSAFSGNGRQGIGLTNADAQVSGSTFTGRGAGNLVDYGVQAQGTSKVYVTGSTFGEYNGKAAVDGTESAGVFVSQDTDDTTGQPVAGGAQLLAVGDKFSHNRIGVAVNNVSATGTATADVRFSDLSDNDRAIDASAGTTSTATAENDYFGPTTFSQASATAGAVTVTDKRSVTAPTLTIASTYGTAAAPTLATAGPLAATAYVTDPRIQAEVNLAGTSPAAGSPLVVTVNYSAPLAKTADGTAYLFDPTLLTVTYTSSKGVTTTLTSSQYTVTAPAASGDGKSATVTVSAATLTALAGTTPGIITVRSAPSSGSAGTGNAQLTNVGYQTGGTDAFAVPFGSANTGVSLTPIGNLTFNTNGPAQSASTTVTYSAGRTGAVTFSVSPNSLVTVVQGGTSTNPTFTVTPVAGAVGNGVVTVTATDSDGISNSTAFAVQVGGNTAPTASGLPDTTIPYNGTSGPLTVTIGGANQPLTVSATSSNTGVATVAVSGTGSTRTLVVTANPSLTTGGSAAISYTVTDGQGLTTVKSFNVTVAPQRVRLFAVGAGPGSAPVVQVYGQNGVKLFGFTAFELSFTGGVTVATGDVNGDGVDDIIAGASVGGGPRVRVIDGKTGAELANFYAFESTARTGVNVAVGKLLGGTANPTSASGFYREQIIVGAAEGGGPRVSSFDLTQPGPGASPTRINNFFAYEDTFRNGATVAAGDLNGDGLDEIVTGSGNGGGPRVRTFNADGSSYGVDFFAFDQNLRNGISVAAGPLDATGKASIVVGTGDGGGSVVKVFGPTGTATTQFQAYSDASTSPEAVRVATAQFNATGPESIVTGPGVGGGPEVKVFPSGNPAGGSNFADFSFEQPFRGGIFVG